MNVFGWTTWGAGDVSGMGPVRAYKHHAGLIVALPEPYEGDPFLLLSHLNEWLESGLPEPEILPLKSVIVFHMAEPWEAEQIDGVRRHMEAAGAVFAVQLGLDESVESLDDEQMYERGWVRRRMGE